MAGGIGLVPRQDVGVSPFNRFHDLRSRHRRSVIFDHFTLDRYASRDDDAGRMRQPSSERETLGSVSA